MTQKKYPLARWQADAAIAGRLRSLVFPVDGIVELPGPYTEEAWLRGEMPLFPLGVVGTRVALVEEFHVDAANMREARAQHEDSMSPSPIYYRATSEPENPHAGWRWRAAHTMPAWAAQFYATITTIESRPGTLLTTENYIAAGCSTTAREPGAMVDLEGQMEEHWHSDCPAHPLLRFSMVWVVGLRMEVER